MRQQKQRLVMREDAISLALKIEEGPTNQGMWAAKNWNRRKNGFLLQNEHRLGDTFRLLTFRNVRPN